MPSSLQVLMFWSASAIACCFLLWSSKTARCRAGDVSSWSRHLRFAPLAACAASARTGSTRCAEPLPALPDEASLPDADPPSVSSAVAWFRSGRCAALRWAERLAALACAGTSAGAPWSSSSMLSRPPPLSPIVNTPSAGGAPVELSPPSRTRYLSLLQRLVPSLDPSGRGHAARGAGAQGRARQATLCLGDPEATGAG
ncbi:hypothetical protein T484DRAFT_1958858 [Baffinella frigidus]|nr:hypothetical protein T484DRAFT_1958858 [Cryptophyta sp. CCMP2293]